MAQTQGIQEVAAATGLSKPSITVNYDHIELTDAEMAEIIHRAKAAKAAKIYEAEYRNRLFKEPVYEKLSYEHLDAHIRKTYNVVDATNKELLEDLKKQRIDPFIIDDYNREIYEMLCQYFSEDPGFELQDECFSLKKGIMLVGPVGCGKTSLMRMFGPNSFRPFKVIHCREIADDYSANGSAVLKTYADMQIGYAHQNFGHTTIGRCYDDLGTEEIKKNFGNQVNVMQDIIYKIYDNPKTLIGNFHTTTNLSGDEIEAAYGTRVRSRLREMFNQIQFNPTANDRRK